MKKILLLVLLSCPVLSIAQVPDSLSLSLCHSDAINNFPLIKQRELLDKITAEKIKNLQTNYLPQVYLNGSASYQSAVTEIPINVPFLSIPVMDKDMYKINLDVNQVVYDGGLTRNQQQLEKISQQVDRQNLEAELYKLKERVNQLYFSLLIIQQNRKILELVFNELGEREAKIESGVRNGLILESQLDILQAEKLKIEQQLVELDVNRQSGLLMLGEFLNKNLPANQAISLPSVAEFNVGLENKRLEPLVMELQQQRLEMTKNLSGSKYKPKIFAVAQAGYGKPGLNMLDNEFDTFWLVGAKLSWNLWSWNQLKKEQKIVDLQKDIIGTQRQTFDKNLMISLENQTALINKFTALLSKDNDIISLRGKVTKAAASQLEHGVITSSEYVTELNNETQAKLNKESHRIQLVKAWVDYLTIQGRY